MLNKLKQKLQDNHGGGGISIIILMTAIICFILIIGVQINNMLYVQIEQERVNIAMKNASTAATLQVDYDSPEVLEILSRGYRTEYDIKNNNTDIIPINVDRALYNYYLLLSKNLGIDLNSALSYTDSISVITPFYVNDGLGNYTVRNYNLKIYKDITIQDLEEFQVISNLYASNRLLLDTDLESLELVETTIQSICGYSMVNIKDTLSQYNASVFAVIKDYPIYSPLGVVNADLYGSGLTRIARSKQYDND